MEKLKELKKLIRLRKELTRHDYRYYILAAKGPVDMISDQSYDRMYRQYQELLIEVVGLDTRSNETEEQYPQWVRDELGGRTILEAWKMKIWICVDDKVAEVTKVVDSKEKATTFVEKDKDNHWTMEFEVE